MSAKPEGVVHFYNGRGTTEQWIKEGKYALHWTRLSCKRFVSNQVRLGLFVLAYNLGNFLTLFIDGHRYAAFFHRWVGAAFSGRAFFPVAESYKG